MAIAKQVAVGNRNKTGKSTSQPTPLVVLEHDSFLEKIDRFEANIYRVSDLIVKLSLRSSVSWILCFLTFFFDRDKC